MDEPFYPNQFMWILLTSWLNRILYRSSPSFLVLIDLNTEKHHSHVWGEGNRISFLMAVALDSLIFFCLLFPNLMGIYHQKLFLTIYQMTPWLSSPALEKVKNWKPPYWGGREMSCLSSGLCPSQPRHRHSAGPLGWTWGRFPFGHKEGLGLVLPSQGREPVKVHVGVISSRSVL